MVGFLKSGHIYYHCYYCRFMQLISLVPTDPTVLQRLGDMYEDTDKSQSFQYYLEVATHCCDEFNVEWTMICHLVSWRPLILYKQQNLSMGLKCFIKYVIRLFEYYGLLGKPQWAPHQWITPTIISVIDHTQKLQQKLVNLHIFREFNGVDYNASLYGLYYCPSHDN